MPARCANALAPILISTEQGMCKSTFCSIILSEEEAFYKVFTLPKEGESCLKLTATDIFNTLQKRFPKVMQGIKPQRIGNIMTRIGAKKIHTRQGNVYSVKHVKAVCELKFICPYQTICFVH